MSKVSVTYQVWDSLHNYKHRNETGSLDECTQLAVDWLQDMQKHRLKLPRLVVVEVTKDVTVNPKYGWLGETITSRPVKMISIKDNNIVMEDSTEWLS